MAALMSSQLPGPVPVSQSRHPPTSTQPQPQPTSHPHRSGVNPTGSLNGIINNNVNNNSNTSTRPEPPPRESSQSRSTNAAAGNTRNSSFPHAFERWEMLSSRWEGLTGYWISKLEQNRHELANMPLEQQMSRQITDLSAAGANLFHAVVELQRLRASSERKFQRWFFETRADQERSREMSSELEATLRVERQKRADAMAVVARLEKEKSTAEKLVEEYRRELQISREECRRSWEELGRREQEERERRNSLREGNPTLVGDYQVLPMPMPGVPSRPSGSGRPQTSAGGHHDQHDQSHIPGPHSGSQAHSSTAGATAPSSSQRGSRSPVAYPPLQAEYGGNLAVEYQRDEDGHLVLDAKGDPIIVSYRHSRIDPEDAIYPDYDGSGYGAPIQAPNPPMGGGYGGYGYGGGYGPGWEGITRHHHPTRLSDVVEEEERTHTSASNRSR
ncbi:hypothetical protein L211DRAFT_856243 [Terfezia boudieri ATCC MYA-4762]|uniref:Uncharacterized protein n=1 Tax=Terfezia boudieri ATCC MYA-4762 TaxID=1051890 RepID=A0A3N4LUF3_9PEZI|nr:hypothetical protein L211DRAFT_856243 [Terfezia boudieri ATCC MYA-4762]